MDTEDKMFAAYNFLSNAAEKARKEGKKKVASERASELSKDKMKVADVEQWPRLG